MSPRRMPENTVASGASTGLSPPLHAGGQGSTTVKSPSTDPQPVSILTVSDAFTLTVHRATPRLLGQIADPRSAQPVSAELAFRIRLPDPPTVTFSEVSYRRTFGTGGLWAGTMVGVTRSATVKTNKKRWTVTCMSRDPPRVRSSAGSSGGGAPTGSREVYHKPR